MPIASDVGDCLFTAMDIDNTALVAPGYYATMGFGVPGGPRPAGGAPGERPLILVGDGAFQMTGWELGNCRALRLGPDRARVQQRELGDAAHLPARSRSFNDLDDWRFAEWPRGLGGDGVRVRTRRELRDGAARAPRPRAGASS